MFDTAFRSLEVLYPRPLRYLNRYLADLVEGRLWLKVLIGMGLGLLAGVALGPSVGWVSPNVGTVIGNWLALPGQLFLAALQMIVIPLVFASVVRGLAAGENINQLQKLGSVTAAWFVLTTGVAAALGLWVAGVLEPGRSLEVAPVAAAAPVAPPAHLNLGELPERLVGLLPGNPLDSMVQGQMLQVVIFSFVVGIALISMRVDAARPMLDLLGSVQEVCMTVVRWAMKLAPIAVFGLMARLTSQIGLEALLGMAFYVVTVLLGLLLLFTIYLGVLFVLAGRRPLPFVRDVREVLLLAFSTSSSAAVMPLSIRTAEEKLAVRPSVAQFVIPLGATINMNGTALYQGAATAFLAQVYGIDIGTGGMLLVVALAVGASIGSPATPGVGIVILGMVVSSIGVPPSGIALIIGVDRILDMSRTAINVAGDLTACVLVDRWVGGERSAEDERIEEQLRAARRTVSGEDTVTVPKP